LDQFGVAESALERCREMVAVYTGVTAVRLRAEGNLRWWLL